jgi:hypothetical protein
MTPIISFIPKLSAYFLMEKAPHLKWYSNYEKSLPIRNYAYDDFDEHTPSEKAMLSFYVKGYSDIIFNLFPVQTISFIKTVPGKDWDFPYTFIIEENNVIVISAKTLQSFSKLGFNNRFVQETILHEIIHLHQKRHPKDYDKYYIDAYHFRKVKCSNYASFAEKVITNPDGYVSNNNIWVININKDMWYPYLEISMKEKLTKVIKNGNDYSITSDEAPPEVYLIYADMFRVQSQRYHPNEIFARINAKKLIFGL